MQSRVDRYTLTAQIKKLKRTAPCAIHQARWIRDRAIAHDANAVLRPPPMAPALPAHGIEGLDSVLALARLPAEMEQMLEQQLYELLLAAGAAPRDRMCQDSTDGQGLNG